MKEHELHSGHRGRLDEKSRIIGLEFLEEHEQLEKLLFAVIPRGDTNAIAHALLNRFGSVYGVLTAEVEHLREVQGVGVRTAEFLHDLMPLFGIVERSIMGSGRIILDTPEKMGAYAKSLFNGKVVENLYMISLNVSRQIIRVDKIAEGTATASNVSLKKIARLAVLNEAYSIVLAHNHPGGTPEPSYADISITNEIKRVLENVGVALLDHIIVACGKWYSMNLNK